jgi:pimeloyl-ACP methyl ester carboxylesterase
MQAEFCRRPHYKYYELSHRRGRSMSNASWRAARLAELMTASQVADTTAGPIEFAQSGSSPFVMHLHGTPGGYDQGLPLGVPFLTAGMGSLSVSRPGYLRTPISVGRTPAQQADAFAVLLDHLNIERIAVQGVSGGGPSAIHFAARHPDRTSALLLTCAVTTGYPIDIPAWSKLLMTPQGIRLGEWMMAKFPGPTVKQLIAGESTYSAEQVKEATERVMQDPKLMKFLEVLTKSSSPWEDRQPGFDNDIEVIQSVEVEPLPLEAVQCPTLIIHGSADDDVPYSVAVKAHERINNSELYTMADACHLLWIDPGVGDMEQRQIDFVRAHA